MFETTSGAVSTAERPPLHLNSTHLLPIFSYTMSDPNHPIFKQFTELDPTKIIIRDTPHPDQIWNQPPVSGTLTPGYAHRIPGQPYIPGSDKPWVPSDDGLHVPARSQEWQPNFPGLWDDVPRSGTSNMSHAQPYPLPRFSANTPLGTDVKTESKTDSSRPTDSSAGS